jgi:hypothetical protein
MGFADFFSCCLRSRAESPVSARTVVTASPGRVLTTVFLCWAGSGRAAGGRTHGTPASSLPRKLQVRVTLSEVQTRPR